MILGGGGGGGAARENGGPDDETSRRNIRMAQCKAYMKAVYIEYVLAQCLGAGFFKFEGPG